MLHLFQRLYEEGAGASSYLLDLVLTLGAATIICFLQITILISYNYLV